MKPEDLRKQLAAKQPEITESPNSLDIYGDEKTKRLMFRFHHPTNNFVLSEEQARTHIDTLLKCARACGIDYTGEIQWVRETATTAPQQTPKTH